MGSKGFRLDMTVMYAVHDSFRRDLGRLARIAVREDDDPQRILSAAAGWEMFKTFLRLHDSAEDEGLWPAMRPAMVSRQDDVALLEALEAEHESIDPMLEAIDRALADRDTGPARLADLVDTLGTSLSAHLSHEEKEGLPLVDRTLSEEEWRSFVQVHHRRIGTHAPRYLPWLLDGATADKAATILDRLPEPVRLACQNEWQVVYEQLDLWDAGDGRDDS